MVRRTVLLGCILLVVPACATLFRLAGAGTGAAAGSLGGPGLAAAGGIAGVTAGDLAYQEVFGSSERTPEDEATLADLLRVAAQASKAENTLRTLLKIALGVGILGILLGWWGTTKAHRIAKEVKNGSNQG